MTQKYRHHGYRDTEREDRGRDTTTRRPPQDRSAQSEGERAQQRSLRHALERDAREVIRCPGCGRNVPAVGAVATDNRCTHCGASLHCCRTCKSFDTAVSWECRKADRIPARIPDKAAPNTCPHYEPGLILDSTGKRTTPGPRGAGNDPKSQFDNLFKR
jgi:hypothetical protein